MNLFNYNEPQRTWHCKLEFEMTKEDIDWFLSKYRHNTGLCYDDLTEEQIKQYIEELACKVIYDFKDYHINLELEETTSKV